MTPLCELRLESKVVQHGSDLMTVHLRSKWRVRLRRQSGLVEQPGVSYLWLDSASPPVERESARSWEGNFARLFALPGAIGAIEEAFGRAVGFWLARGDVRVSVNPSLLETMERFKKRTGGVP